MQISCRPSEEPRPSCWSRHTCSLYEVICKLQLLCTRCSRKDPQHSTHSTHSTLTRSVGASWDGCWGGVQISSVAVLLNSGCNLDPESAECDQAAAAADPIPGAGLHRCRRMPQSHGSRQTLPYALSRSIGTAVETGRGDNRFRVSVSRSSSHTRARGKGPHAVPKGCDGSIRGLCVLPRGSFRDFGCRDRTRSCRHRTSVGRPHNGASIQSALQQTIITQARGSGKATPPGPLRNAPRSCGDSY